MDLTTTQPGTLPAGTATDYGRIVRASLTAYEMEDGSWVAFQKIHGPRTWVTPLVVFS